MEEYIIGVDEKDNEICKIEKLEAHVKGVLHRALSIFIFNNKGELLLQKRYRGKYHSPSLWTNTCCTHPNIGESIGDAAKRRLNEEVGFTCDLKEIFTFIYKAKFTNNLIEHEFDHVLIGTYEGDIHLNPLEVEEYRWIDLDSVRKDIHINGDKYTYWFKYIISNYYDKIKCEIE